MKPFYRFAISIIIIMTAASLLGHAQPGYLDPTFGTGGKVVVGDGSNYWVGYSLAIQSDGKSVVGGTMYDAPFFPMFSNFALIRLKSDGSLDSSFGTNGMVTTFFGFDQAEIHSLAIQTDGKIVAAGFAGSPPNFSNRFALARYNPDGSLDSTFGINGTLDTLIGNSNSGQSIAIQNDGKILLAGSVFNGISYFSLLRFNNDGSLDSLFASNGVVTTQLSNSSVGYSVAIQNDGKIVVGGGNDNFELIRVDSAGNLDNTFGSGGIVTTDFFFGTDVIRSIQLQADGKIVAVGEAGYGVFQYFGIARYNLDGTLDTTFANGGIDTTGFATGAGYSSFGRAAAIQNDGKILAAGETQGGFGLARYTTNGSLDTTFGNRGLMTTDFLTSYNVSIAYSIAIQNDEKILVAGRTYSSQPLNNYIAVARYNSDPLGIFIRNFETVPFTIYPNPASAYFSVRLQEGSKMQASLLEIYDLPGLKIHASYFNSELQTFNAVDFASGVYFVKVFDGNKWYCKKLIIEHN